MTGALTLYYGDRDPGPKPDSALAFLLIGLHIGGTSTPLVPMDTSPAHPTPPDPPPPLGSPEDLFGLLYTELHALAKRQLARQGHDYSLGTTTLLHEAYLNVAARSDVRFPDRARFLGYAARAMRGLIVDYFRRRAAVKRGGEFHLLPLEETEVAGPVVDATGLDELSEALDQLTDVDPALAELVDLHFFCGLDFVEIAGIRGVSDRTVQRDWRKARLILHQALRPDSGGGPFLP